MLVVQSDEPAGYALSELEAIAELCRANGATEVFHTDDPEEGEAFVVARRMAIPAVERRGSLLLEDVGVPIPALGALVEGIAAISAAHDVEIAVIAHAGDSLRVGDDPEGYFARRGHPHHRQALSAVKLHRGPLSNAE